MAVRPSPRLIGRQTGRSLVEIMIALVIGFVVLGALMLNTIGTGDSGRRQDAAAELETEGRVALNLIATQIRLAGRSPLRVNTSPGAADTNYTGIGLRGCDNGFQDYHFGAAPQISDLVCQAAGPGSHGAAFSVVYEADTSTSGAVPALDCRGSNKHLQQIPSVTDPSVTVPIVENRFHIGAPTTGVTRTGLYCAGSGALQNDEMIPNVESMTLEYGISAGKVGVGTTATPVAVMSNQVVRYLDQTDLDAYMAKYVGKPVNLQDEWSRVVSVRVCVLMASDPGVVTSGTNQYIDCHGALQTSTDTRLRRAVTATITRGPIG